MRIKISPRELFQKLLCAVIGICSSAYTFSSDVYIGGNNYEYSTSLGGPDLDFTATGFTIGADIDINDNIFLQAAYSRAEDDKSLMGSNQAHYESDYWSIGIGYALERWQVYFGYSAADDDVEHVHGAQNELSSTANIDWKSLRLYGDYTREIGAWAYTISSGIQYDETEIDTQVLPPDNLQPSDSDIWYANIKLSSDYYFPVSDNAGLYLGASINWYERIAGDSVDTQAPNNVSGADGPRPPPPPRPGGAGGGGNRGNGGAIANGTSGNSYGLFGLFLVYDLNENWSLDWNTSLGFGGDENANSHALTLSYFF